MANTKNPNKTTDTGSARSVERRPSHAPSAGKAVREEIELRMVELEPEVELLAVDVASGKLQIFIDAPGGVTHDLCVRVTRHLTDLLTDYTVEVSSPGLTRPLSKPAHFERFVGSRVRIRTYETIEGHNDFKAELTGADHERITLETAWGPVGVTYDQIRKANLVAEAGRQH